MKMGTIWIYALRLAGRKKKKESGVAVGLNNPTLTGRTLFLTLCAPSFPFSCIWETCVAPPQPYCFPKFHYPQSQTDLEFLLTFLPSCSFISFSPTAKFPVIYSRKTILQLQLF